MKAKYKTFWNIGALDITSCLVIALAIVPHPLPSSSRVFPSQSQVLLTSYAALFEADGAPDQWKGGIVNHDRNQPD